MSFEEIQNFSKHTLDQDAIRLNQSEGINFGDQSVVPGTSLFASGTADGWRRKSREWCPIQPDCTIF
jgi:hypothetical protein